MFVTQDSGWTKKSTDHKEEGRFIVEVVSLFRECVCLSVIKLFVSYKKTKTCIQMIPSVVLKRKCMHMSLYIDLHACGITYICCI